LDKFWKEFGFGNFWDLVQRRGVHVNTPKIGSRVGVLCFGGIYQFYAELRRDFKRGNLDLLFFCGLGGVPRRLIEEGGEQWCNLGEFRGFWGSKFWGGTRVQHVRDLLTITMSGGEVFVRDEGIPYNTTPRGEGRGDSLQYNA
jgi:hypothetical protein